MKYLLDTNICIYLKKGDQEIAHKVEEVLSQNCFISEVTVAELKLGAEYSELREMNMQKVNLLLAKFEAIPISPAIDDYAREQAALIRIGKRLEKFDALIAATAIVKQLTLVTNDFAFSRIEKLKIENWATHLLTTPKHSTPVSQP
jgi:tRNA(fMet)-specific endonuclease VapC